MNIGVDATCWWNNRGFGRFTRELLTALFTLPSEHRFHLFVDQPLRELSRFDNVHVIEVASGRPTTEAAVADSNRSPRDMYRMYRAVANTPLDCMFFPAVYSWYPVPRGLPTLLTVHDAIAEHFPRLIFPQWKHRLFWTLKVKAALWQSRRVLTVSQAAKDEIVTYMGVNPDRIDVTCGAPNAIFHPMDDAAALADARQRAGLPVESPLIVYVGGLAPHKNLHGLLEGFERFLQQDHTADTHLALVGDFRGAGFLSNYDSLRARVAASDALRGRVHFPGHVSDHDLVALYSSALAVAMPSFSEGFGLPAIEAMACGVPILSSDRGSLPEVVGDAGAYFDPRDIAAISRAIASLATDPSLRERLAGNALQRARQFTWERAARLTLGYLEAL